MSRKASPAASPTVAPVSNYFTDSDRSVQNARTRLSLGMVDYSQHSRAQYTELRSYLQANFLSSESSASRSKANSELPSLTNQYFYELSTDVYSEVVRRNADNQTYCSPVRDEFHPKRNEARQTMASFSADQLQEVSSEVFLELERRYPQLKEEIEIMNIQLPSEANRVRDHTENQTQERQSQPQNLSEQLKSALQRAEDLDVLNQAILREFKALRQDYYRQVQQIHQDEEEIADLRARCDKLEKEKRFHQQEVDFCIARRNNDIAGLRAEVKRLSIVNSELMATKDSSSEVNNALESELKEYKQKYEQAKDELESLKAISSSIAQASKLDEEPEDKVLVNAPDIHIALFNSAIDKLLSAGRRSDSNQSKRVQAFVKQASDAVDNILQDIKELSQRPWNRQSETNIQVLLTLGDHAQQTLDNLVAASQMYVSSSTTSPPFSLIEAATKPISAAITEIGKKLYIPQAVNADNPPFPSIYAEETPSRAPWPSAMLKSKNVVGSQTATTPSTRNTSQYSTSKAEQRTLGSQSSLTLDLEQCFFDSLQRSLSDHLRNLKVSPVRISIAISDNSERTDRSEVYASIFGVFQPYLEAQSELEARTESIVTAIEDLLSDLGTPRPWPTLAESLLNIIRIASEITDTYETNFPTSNIPSPSQVTDVVRGLREHTDNLRKIQALPDVTQESWQVVSISSLYILDTLRLLLSKP